MLFACAFGPDAKGAKVVKVVYKIEEERRKTESKKAGVYSLSGLPALIDFGKASVTVSNTLPMIDLPRVK